MARKLKIGVMGAASGNHSQELLEKAEQIGNAIAKNNCIMFYGATIGFPLAAAKAAKKAGGLVIGVSPAENEKDQIEKYKYPVEPCDAVIYTAMGLGGGRNTILVKSCDAVILINGRIGTMNEFSVAYATKRPIGVLKGSGGITDRVKELENEVLKGEMDTAIVYDSDPAELVKKLISVLRDQKN